MDVVVFDLGSGVPLLGPTRLAASSVDFNVRCFGFANDASICPIGGRHPADGVFHHHGLCAMCVLAGEERTRPAGARADAFVWSGADKDRRRYFFGFGVGLDNFAALRPACIPVSATIQKCDDILRFCHIAIRLPAVQHNDHQL